VSVDGGGSADALFAPAARLEIRNLTSHHLRTWSPIEERGDALTYGLPANRLYWQILSPEAVKRAAAGPLLEEDAGGPIIVFHNKPRAFDLGNDRDRVEHLLAIGALPREQGRGESLFVARAPHGRGGHLLEALKVQQDGNVTLSPLYRPKRDLEIRWALAAGGRDAIAKALKGGSGAISGAIRIVSPSRSLGTADQGPVGDEPVDCCDFPARITYAINYSIAVNAEEFVEDQAGIAIAVGVDDVPPRDVTVAFDKPHIGHVLSRYLEFGPGHCTGMHEISQAEYDHGVNFCRYWRTVPLDPTDPRWASLEDFDPARLY
jgi:hypothetical protein